MRSTNLNKIIILCGPPASGKDTLTRYLMQLGDYCKVRLHRASDIHKPGYINTDKAEFKALKSNGKFIESHNAYGNNYGVSREEVLKCTAEYKYSIIHLGSLEQALEVKSNLPEVEVIIILLLNSFAEIVCRLAERHKGDKAEIANRLKLAESERIKSEKLIFEVADFAIRVVDVEKTARQIHTYLM